MRVILSCLLFISSFCIGQSNSFVVTGKVILGSTGQPLQGASVFAENTTLGTATDAEGNFKLWLPNGGYDIVVTYTGYGTQTRRVTSSEILYSLQFEMKPKEKELSDVVVVSSNEIKDGWNIYGQFFLEQFIGQTENSQQCFLLNKEVLKFYFSKRRNRLKIMAEEPLLIRNNALGYNIKYNLDSFTHEYATQVSLYTGFPLFEEMVSESSAQRASWKNSREEAYNGSILHFMRSLYKKDLRKEGYEIQFVVKVNDEQKALKLKDFYAALNYIKDDSAQTVEIKPNQTEVGVIYNNEKPSPDFISRNENEPKDFQFSVLSFAPRESIVVEQNGYYFQQTDITINAYWTWERVAELLPYDYGVPLTIPEDQGQVLQNPNVIERIPTADPNAQPEKSDPDFIERIPAE